MSTVTDEMTEALKGERIAASLQIDNRNYSKQQIQGAAPVPIADPHLADNKSLKRRRAASVHDGNQALALCR